MYEEEKKNSFIKDLIIKLLYFFLFLFLFIWLYPAPKVNLDDVKVNVDKEVLDPLYKQIFNSNINSMKDAGRSYFTTDRLPNKAGDKVKISLKEMLSKKLLLEFTDEEGNACNADESYVEVTKTNDKEYNMRVYLSCNNKKDYINEIIGCNNICPSGTCNNITSSASSSIKRSTTGSTSNQNTVTKNTTTYVPTPGKNTTTTVYVDSNSGNNPNNDNNRKVTAYFNAQGGTNVNSQTVNVGSTAYEPATSRSGYTFKCWSTVSNDENCNYKFNFNTPLYSDITLYAQWQKVNNVQYEYVKTVWDPDYTWTTQYKTGSNVKIINQKTVNDESTNRKNYTYRTISWFFGREPSYSYGLWINNIPSNARNVRMTSLPIRFTSRSDIETYKRNRYSCVIQMVGYGCSTPYDDGIISNEDEQNHAVGSFTFNYSSLQKQNNRYRIDFQIYNQNVYDSDYQYLAPIKFTISWDEVTYNRVTKYQYSYKSTKTKYSTSNNDTSLLNDGYRLTGRTK